MCISVAFFVATAAAASSGDVPQAFGKARLKMSEKDFVAAYPEAERLGGDKAPAVGSGLMTLYRLQGQEYQELKLKPCSVTFHFAWDQLYQIDFDCGRDEKIATLLEKKFGRPTRKLGQQGTYWYRDDTVVSMNPRSRTFAISDRALGENVTKSILADIYGGRLPGQKSGSALPPGKEAGGAGAGAKQ